MTDEELQALIEPLGDPNVKIAIIWGRDLSYPFPSIPHSLKSSIEQRAKFIRVVNPELDFSHLANKRDSIDTARAEYLKDVVNVTKRELTDLGAIDDKEVASLCFRLWAGCILAAKTVAYDDSSGHILTKEDKTLLSRIIDTLAINDPIFRAGVEAGCTYRELKDEPLFFDGIPKTSYIRALFRSPS